MMNCHSKISAALLAGAMLTLSTVSYASPMPANASNIFRVTVGATRVVYQERGAGAQLSVSNQQDYPILVQSSVTGEDKKSAAPFLVTPPLFRLEANQQSRLRVIRTGGNIVALFKKEHRLSGKHGFRIETMLAKDHVCF